MVSLRNQVIAWITFGLFMVVVLWLFRGILLPFVVGIALAYLLNPVVSLLQRLRLSRGWATSLVLLLVLAIIVGLFYMVVPLAVSQVIGLSQLAPEYVTQLRGLAEEWLPQFNTWIGEERVHQIEAQINEWINNAPAFTATVTAWLAQSGWSVLSTVGLAIVAPVVAFYLLLDWDAMVQGLDDLLPRDHRVEIQEILGQIDHSISAVIRGQGSVILVLTVYYASALSVVGLSFGLAVGILTGLFSFIPFVGFFAGFIVSIGIALVQFWPNWVMVVVVAAVFGIGQFLEGNVLYPKLVGSSIGINPVWFMFALFAFALLFGFVGLLLAVPLAAIFAVLFRWAAGKYRSSPLYTGRHGNGAAAIPVVEGPELPPPAPPSSPRRRSQPRTRRKDE